MVFACRRVIEVAASLTVRLHITGDERYELWLDGERIAEGPDRSDERTWAYASWELTLQPGRHVLMARVWALGRLAPWAQRSVAPGFLCAAEGEAESLLSTGVAPWEIRRVNGYRFHDISAAAGTAIGAGAVEELDLAQCAWDPLDDRPHAEWIQPRRGAPGNNGCTVLLGGEPLLTPSPLPPQRSVRTQHVRVRARDDATAGSNWESEQPDAAWQRLLAGDEAITIAPSTNVRILLDTGRYWCGRPEVIGCGGVGATISVFVAEALVHAPTIGVERVRRDSMVGGRLRVAADRLHGAAGPWSWRTLWWRAGRYVEIAIETADEPLTLTSVSLINTGYPFVVVGAVEEPAAADARDARLHAACADTWLACAHETYMDCPHYEQLMYLGDTRVQALITYALSPDARLPARCLELFASGLRVGRGLIPDAYPAGYPKLIPPFALWWVAMVHDYAWWRAAPPPAWLAAMRVLIDRFIGEIGADGLWPSSPSWNFLDWCDGFTYGTPPGGEEGGRNASFNWQLALALGQWADLETKYGEPEMAQRARRHQRRLVDAIESAFWDDVLGLYHEDQGHTCRTEHAQVLALLSGTLSPDRHLRVAETLFTASSLVRSSAYFSHYLFEVAGQQGRIDLIDERLSVWHTGLDNGLVTTPETFLSDCRSDCHAWSAHPLFHALATRLGVRPAAPGFAQVRIAPLLGTRVRLAGTVAHPHGTITVEIQRTPKGITAQISLPAGIPGILCWAGRDYPLIPGEQRLEV